MKQIYLAVFAAFVVGITTIGGAYALEVAVVDKGDLSIDSSSNHIGSTTIGSSNIHDFEGDHTISSTEFFKGVVDENSSLVQRVRVLTSSDPSANAPPSQAQPIITKGHEYLSLNGQECPAEKITFRSSHGNITVEGKIGSGDFYPTYKGVPLEPFHIPEDKNPDCEWNRVIIDLPTELQSRTVIDQTEDEYFYYVTYRIPK